MKREDDAHKPLIIDGPTSIEKAKTEVANECGDRASLPHFLSKIRENDAPPISETSSVSSTEDNKERPPLTSTNRRSSSFESSYNSWGDFDPCDDADAAVSIPLKPQSSQDVCSYTENSHDASRPLKPQSSRIIREHTTEKGNDDGSTPRKARSFRMIRANPEKKISDKDISASEHSDARAPSWTGISKGTKNLISFKAMQALKRVKAKLKVSSQTETMNKELLESFADLVIAMDEPSEDFSSSESNETSQSQESAKPEHPLEGKDEITMTALKPHSLRIIRSQTVKKDTDKDLSASEHGDGDGPTWKTISSGTKSLISLKALQALKRVKAKLSMTSQTETINEELMESFAELVEAIDEPADPLDSKDPLPVCKSKSARFGNHSISASEHGQRTANVGKTQRKSRDLLSKSEHRPSAMLKQAHRLSSLEISSRDDISIDMTNCHPHFSFELSTSADGVETKEELKNDKPKTAMSSFRKKFAGASTKISDSDKESAWHESTQNIGFDDSYQQNFVFESIGSGSGVSDFKEVPEKSGLYQDDDQEEEAPGTPSEHLSPRCRDKAVDGSSARRSASPRAGRSSKSSSEYTPRPSSSTGRRPRSSSTGRRKSISSSGRNRSNSSSERRRTPRSSSTGPRRSNSSSGRTRRGSLELDSAGSSHERKPSSFRRENASQSPRKGMAPVTPRRQSRRSLRTSRIPTRRLSLDGGAPDPPTLEQQDNNVPESFCVDAATPMATPSQRRQSRKVSSEGLPSSRRGSAMMTPGARDLEILPW